MAKKIVIHIAKFIFPVAVFVIAWLFLQELFIPKYLGDSTTIVDGFYELKENSIEVLFLGPSQMFCGIDSQKLTEEYGIQSYDFGASSQNLTITYYYLQEALKTQKPELILVEVCEIFEDDSMIDESVLAWNYSPTHFSIEKWKSLHRVLDGDLKRVISYSFPLLQYHGAWKEVKMKDLTYIFSDKRNRSRGYLARDRVWRQEIDFLAEDEGAEKQVSEDSMRAIDDIVNLCNKNGIQVIFFKVPVANWTRNDSKITKEYMNRLGLEYVDLNDYLDEIRIDGETDFYNKEHLNSSGAAKTTDFMAKWLKAR